MKKVLQELALALAIAALDDWMLWNTDPLGIVIVPKEE